MSAIGSAATWLQGTMLGSLATVAALIAVAQIGFMMLTGRIDWRRGGRVILGCCIVFGAPSLALSFSRLASNDTQVAPLGPVSAPLPQPSFDSPESALYERCPAGWCRKARISNPPE